MDAVGLRRVGAAAREHVLIPPSSAAAKTDWPSAEKVGAMASKPLGSSSVGAATAATTGLPVAWSSENVATDSCHNGSPRRPCQVSEREAAGGGDRHAWHPLNQRTTLGRSGAGTVNLPAERISSPNSDISSHQICEGSFRGLPPASVCKVSDAKTNGRNGLSAGQTGSAMNTRPDPGTAHRQVTG